MVHKRISQPGQGHVRYCTPGETEGVCFTKRARQRLNKQSLGLGWAPARLANDEAQRVFQTKR